MRKLHAPIDFNVADEAGHDLSPLYLDMDEPWRFGVYFRRAGAWWNLRWYGGRTSLERSTAVVHQPGAWPFHTKIDGAGQVLFGPDYSYAAPHGPTWKVWGVGLDDTFIPVPPGEDVLGLTKIGDRPALLTREGDAVRARTPEDVRTVVEFAGPVLRHYELPWVAVQRSAHLIEVLDIATGAVLHRVRTAGGTTGGSADQADREHQQRQRDAGSMGGSGTELCRRWSSAITTGIINLEPALDHQHSTGNPLVTRGTGSGRRQSTAEIAPITRRGHEYETPPHT